MDNFEGKSTDDLTQDKLFLSFVRDSIDPIITLDERGTVENFNLDAENLFHYKEKELLGKNVELLFPNVFKTEQYIINKIINREVEAKRKDDVILYLNLSISEVKIDGKKLLLE